MTDARLHELINRHAACLLDWKDESEMIDEICALRIFLNGLRCEIPGLLGESQNNTPRKLLGVPPNGAMHMSLTNDPNT